MTLENRAWQKKITIPNGTLSKATIVNCGQEGIWQNVSVGFSYDDAPDRVMSALKSIAAGFDNDLGFGGQVFPFINSFGDSSINYDIWFNKVPDGKGFLFNQFLTRIYYLAKRHNFTIPYPIEVQYNYDAKEGLPNRLPNATDNRLQEMADFLRTLTYLSSLEDTKINELATKAKFLSFGSGEYIIRQGLDDEGLYFVYTGKVRISTKTLEGDERELNSLRSGSVFGELAIFPGEVSPITAVADRDAQVVLIPDKDVMQLIESNPKFSSEFSQFIEQRRRAMEALQGIGRKSQETAASNGKVRSLN